MASSGAASSNDDAVAPPSRLVPVVRAWHRLLSHGEAPEESAWERDAWDEHVRTLRADESRRRVVWEIGRSSAEHVRHRMSEGLPTAIPAGILMIVAFALTATNPDGLPTFAHLTLSAAMGWSAFLFLRWPSALPRRAVVAHGALWATAMGTRWSNLRQVDEVGDVVLQGGHLVLFASGVGFGIQAIRSGRGSSVDLVVPFIAAALGSAMVALANVGWSQTAPKMDNIVGMLGFGAVAALVGYSHYRIRHLPFTER